MFFLILGPFKNDYKDFEFRMTWKIFNLDAMKEKVKVKKKMLSFSGNLSKISSKTIDYLLLISMCDSWFSLQPRHLKLIIYLLNIWKGTNPSQLSIDTESEQSNNYCFSITQRPIYLKTHISIKLIHLLILFSHNTQKTNSLPSIVSRCLCSQSDGEFVNSQPLGYANTE